MRSIFIFQIQTGSNGLDSILTIHSKAPHHSLSAFNPLMFFLNEKSQKNISHSTMETIESIEKERK